MRPIVRVLAIGRDTSRRRAIRVAWLQEGFALAIRTLHLSSVEQLVAQADAWDDLWRRSAVTIPTPQAALLHQWLQQFGGPHAFEAIIIERDGVWLAALPLVKQRLRGMLPAATMPSNHWTPAGDLLVDESADEEIYEALAAAIDSGPWSLLWLDFAITDAPRWLHLVKACEAYGLRTDVHPHFRLPRVDIEGSWETYRATWSRNHRQNLARARRKLVADHGPLTLRHLRPQASDAIEALVAEGFAIEDRSWKGIAGSSVVRSPGMLAFFIEQAKLLAARDQLEIAFLDLADRPIAFMYAWDAKRVFHAFKAGYDEAFAAYSPGQLLIHDLLESMFATKSHTVFDCVGPATPATERWQTSDYEAGRIVIASRHLLGQTAFLAYKHLAPTLRHWKQAVRAGFRVSAST